MNTINPNGICSECAGACPKHARYCTLRCREKAKNKRRKLKEMGEPGRRYEQAKVEEIDVPPFPDCSWETLEAVASELASGEKARFEGANGSEKVPEGCLWQVENGIGTLTKLRTEGAAE